MSENAFTPALGRVAPTRFYDHVIDRDAPVVQDAERLQQASSPEAPMSSRARSRGSLGSGAALTPGPWRSAMPVGEGAVRLDEEGGQARRGEHAVPHHRGTTSATLR